MKPGLYDDLITENLIREIEQCNGVQHWTHEVA